MMVAERLEAVRARIAAAGGTDVRVVAVTKGFGPDAIEAAVAAGCQDVGENYAQEAVTKLQAVRGPVPRVHFIGHLQTNKVKQLAPVVDVWQSVDRPAAVEAIERHAPPGTVVLVQVAAGLHVAGLMAIGRAGEPADARPGFRLLRHLVDDLGLAECSMGMTADLEVAVEEGSTMVRVGTALFGPRAATRSHQRAVQAN